MGLLDKIRGTPAQRAEMKRRRAEEKAIYDQHYREAKLKALKTKAKQDAERRTLRRDGSLGNTILDTLGQAGEHSRAWADEMFIPKGGVDLTLMDPFAPQGKRKPRKRRGKKR